MCALWFACVMVRCDGCGSGGVGEEREPGQGAAGERVREERVCVRCGLRCVCVRDG